MQIEMYESVDIVPVYNTDKEMVFMVCGVNGQATDEKIVLMAAVQILSEMEGTGDWAHLLRQFVASIEVGEDEPVES